MSAFLMKQLRIKRKAICHHRKPGTVFICIFVQELSGLTILISVIWGININALNLSSVPLQEQIQRLEVLAVDEEPIALLIEVVKGGQEPALEVLR
jgi:hypothetical protein